MAVVGGGVVGMEFASLFASFGTKVTVIELLSRILPSEDHECVKELTRSLKSQQVSIETNSKLSSIKDNSDHCTVSVEGKEDRNFETVLLAVGREPVTNKLGLEKLGISLEQSFISVDSHYRTGSQEHLCCR